jgi:thiol-disulfide isomerase/thioredoxin
MKALLLVIMCALGISTTVFADTPGEVKIGEYLREATLHGFYGNTRKFSDYRGKPLIINVWASWCGPCRDEMGSLDRLAQRYGGKQINVIGISTDDFGDAAELYVRKFKISFPNYLDSKVFLENMLGANTIPLTVLVDANGKVLDKVRGAQEWDQPEYIDAIADIFKIKLPH